MDWVIKQYKDMFLPYTIIGALWVYLIGATPFLLQWAIFVLGAYTALTGIIIVRISWKTFTKPVPPDKKVDTGTGF